MNNSLDADQINTSIQFKKWTGLDRSALIMAGISFGLGTILMLTYLVTKAEVLLPIGFAYVGIAFAVNAIILLVLIIDMISHTKRFKSHLQSAGVLLLNLPITWFYMYIIFGQQGMF